MLRIDILKTTLKLLFLRIKHLHDMMRKIVPIVTLFLMLTYVAQGQKDPILFTVNNTDVTVSEFEYIYNKNNTEEDKYSKTSLQEYLDLYVNFKLKVEAAKDMGLDTVAALKNELAVYQQQLADSYLIDKQVKETILREAYERQQTERNISHILVKVGRNAAPADTIKAYKRIMQAYTQLNQKKPFDEVAATYSEDTKSATKGGRVGYIHAVLPNGFYNFESAVYNTPKGKFSKPVRSNIGYHIVQVHDERDARGELEAAHILIRKPKNQKEENNAKERIDIIYTAIQKGADWDEQVAELSEDKATKNKKGNLGFFGINKYESNFEDAAFALKADGDISAPVETSIGWHIIKRISKKERQPFKQAKFGLDKKLQNDQRIAASKRAVINRIKKEGGFSSSPSSFKAMTKAADSTFYDIKWTGFKNLPTSTLFTLGQKQFTTKDFEAYLQRERGPRRRTRSLKNTPQAIQQMYDQYVDDMVLKHEKTQLVYKFPDFKSLMREYDEGILLFEATKRNIWDRALEDTVGLQNFYAANMNNYLWDQRVEVVHYQVKSISVKEMEDIASFAAKTSDPQIVYDKFSKGADKLKYQKLIYEVTDKNLPKQIQLKPNTITIPEFDSKNGLSNFYRVNELLEPSPKALNDARGFVIADYQDELEKSWLTELHKKYPVKINKKALHTLVK